MEKFQELREKAVQTIKKADYMLTMTYPMLQESKILVSVAKNLYSAMEDALTAILEHEKTFKNIPGYSDNFDSKFIIFRDKIAPRYSVPSEHARFISDLREIMSAHSKSPMEFSRKDKFVICSDSYEIRTLTQNDLKKMLNKAKVFIELTFKLTTQHDGIFR